MMITFWNQYRTLKNFENWSNYGNKHTYDVTLFI
jgi:hypothetical protein